MSFKYKEQVVVAKEIGGASGGEFPGAALRTSGKPSVLRYPSTANLKQLGGYIREMLSKDEGCAPLLITTFLLEWANGVTVIAPEDWTSYDRPLALANQNVTPNSLINISESGTMPALASGQAFEYNSEVDCLALTLLAGARVANAPDLHRQKVIDKITSLAAIFPTNGWNFVSLIPCYSKWALEMNYRKIVAAVDMFLSKYSSCTYANFRVATLVSRYNQCSALSATMYLWGICGSDANKMMGFIWVESVVKEIVKIYTPEEEFDRIDSYLPYGAFFGLVNRSAYSAACNPTFTVFAHVVGAFMLNSRSLNAYFDQSAASRNVVINAIVVAYMVFHTSAFKIYAHDVDDNEDQIERVNESLAEKERPELEVVRAQGESEVDYARRKAHLEALRLPINQNYTEWIICVSEHNNTLPREVEDWAKDQASRIPAPRQQTIGEYIYRQYAQGD